MNKKIDPFGGSGSKFGGRADNKANALPKLPLLPTPNQSTTPPSSFLPVPENVNIPVPAPQPNDNSLPSLPQPKFDPEIRKSQLSRNADSLFPDLPEPVTEEIYEEEYFEEEEPELTTEEAYEEVFGEPIPEDFLEYENVEVTETEILTANQLASAANEEGNVQSLYSLVMNDNPSVRFAVASNPSTPVPLLERLSTDEDDMVRAGVMENPATPDHIYENFLNDEDDYLVSSWVDNERTTARMLHGIENTDSKLLALLISDSPKLSPEAKRILENRLVRWK